MAVIVQAVAAAAAAVIEVDTDKHVFNSSRFWLFLCLLNSSTSTSRLS